jgi:putative ABC transport system ATP-binding protein
MTSCKEDEETSHSADKNQEPILQAQGVSRTVDGKRVVDDISFEIQEGSVVAIVGPSGAGKSSLLRILNRLDEPTKGTVLLGGVDYRTLPPPELRRRVGMVMQSPHLFPGTVADNIRFGPQQRGEELDLDTIEELLRRVKLAGYAERDVNNLSVGEAQRVSLARTLANSPSVLLLDEPTSALDVDTRENVEDLICSIIAKSQLTCLIVTHDPDQARRMAGQVMVLESGKRVKLGPVREVLDA